MDVPRQQATYLDLFTIYELHNLVSGKLWKLIGKKKNYYCILSKRNLNSSRLKCF